MNTAEPAGFNLELPIDCQGGLFPKTPRMIVFLAKPFQKPKLARLRDEIQAAPGSKPP